MEKFVISNCNLIAENQIVKNCSIVIANEKIAEIVDGELPCDYDACGNYVSAGLIDIHTHGGYGSDFMDATTDAFDNILRFHIDNGTTSVVATSVTASVESTISFINKAREYFSGDTAYARLLGVHLEGPYLSVRNKGAQKQEFLRSPDKDDYSFIGENCDIVKSVTISPELPNAGEMTKYLTDLGIMVSGGHDDGIYPEFMPSVKNGLRHLTHIYCAMSEVRFKDGRRNVGLREYGLIDDNLTAEMIADNRHITPELAKMIIKAKGVNKVCVVSDSLRCAGMPLDGKLYKLGLQTDETAQLFKVADGVAVLADGTRYAGSITPIRKMVINLIDAGISVCDAFKMATSVPAKIIGRNDLGSIDIGKVADVLVLDKDFGVVDVFKDGKLVNIKK